MSLFHLLACHAVLGSSAPEGVRPEPEPSPAEVTVPTPLSAEAYQQILTDPASRTCVQDSDCGLLKTSCCGPLTPLREDVVQDLEQRPAWDVEQCQIVRCAAPPVQEVRCVQAVCTDVRAGGAP